MPSVSVVCYFMDTSNHGMESKPMIVTANADNGLVQFDNGRAASLRGRVHFLCAIADWDDERTMVNGLSTAFVRKCCEGSSAADDIQTLRTRLEGELHVVPDWLSAHPYLVCNDKAFPVHHTQPRILQRMNTSTEVWTLSYYTVAPPGGTSANTQFIIPHILRTNEAGTLESESEMIKAILNDNGIFYDDPSPIDSATYTAFRNKNYSDTSRIYTISLERPLRYTVPYEVRPEPKALVKTLKSPKSPKSPKTQSTGRHRSRLQ